MRKLQKENKKGKREKVDLKKKKRFKEKPNILLWESMLHSLDFELTAQSLKPFGFTN